MNKAPVVPQLGIVTSAQLWFFFQKSENGFAESPPLCYDPADCTPIVGKFDYCSFIIFLTEVLYWIFLMAWKDAQKGYKAAWEDEIATLNASTKADIEYKNKATTQLKQATARLGHAEKMLADALAAKTDVEAEQVFTDLRASFLDPLLYPQ